MKTVDDGREEIRYRLIKMPDTEKVLVVDHEGTIHGCPLEMYKVVK